MTRPDCEFELLDVARDRRVGLRDLLPAALMAVAVLGFLVVGTMGVRPTGQVVVLGAPWASRAALTDLVWRAEGGVAAYGGLAPLVIAMSDAPDFKERLYQQGAWIVFPSPRFLGCSGQPTEGQNEK